jgi:hypothetical protein
MKDTTDWVTSPATSVSYGNSVIGKTGGIKSVSPLLSPSSGIARSGSVVSAGTSLSSPGLLTGIAVVGKQGLTLDHLRTISATLTRTSIANINLTTQQGKS